MNDISGFFSVIETIASVLGTVLDSPASSAIHSLMIPDRLKRNINISDTVIVFGLTIEEQIHFQSSIQRFGVVQDFIEGVMKLKGIQIETQSSCKLLGFHFTTRRILKSTDTSSTVLLASGQ